MIKGDQPSSTSEVSQHRTDSRARPAIAAMDKMSTRSSSAPPRQALDQQAEHNSSRVNQWQRHQKAPQQQHDRASAAAAPRKIASSGFDSAPSGAIPHARVSPETPTPAATTAPPVLPLPLAPPTGPPPAPLQGEDVYSAERLIAQRWLPGHARPQYRVRWVGYGEAEDTWEPERNILNRTLLDDFHRRHAGGGAVGGADGGGGGGSNANGGASSGDAEGSAGTRGARGLTECAACRGKHVAHVCGLRKHAKRKGAPVGEGAEGLHAKDSAKRKAAAATMRAGAPVEDAVDSSALPPLSAYNRFLQERRAALVAMSPGLSAGEAYAQALDEWRRPETLHEYKRTLHEEQEQAREDWKRRRLSASAAALPGPTTRHQHALGGSGGDSDGGESDEGYVDDAGAGAYGETSSAWAWAGSLASGPVSASIESAAEIAAEAEHSDLVARLRAYMAHSGLSQQRLTAQLHLSSSGALSSWLSSNRAQAAATRLAIDDAVRHYLGDFDEQDGGFVPPPRPQPLLQDGAGSTAPVIALLAVTSGGGGGGADAGAHVEAGTPPLVRVRLAVRAPMAVRGGAGTNGRGGEEDDSEHARAVAAGLRRRLHLACAQHGLSLSRAREACHVSSAGYWYQAWIEPDEPPLPLMTNA